jgi:hypothetical protein
MPFTSPSVLAHLLMAGLARRALAAADLRDEARETALALAGFGPRGLRGVAAAPRPARGAVPVALCRREGAECAANLRT